MGAKDRNLCVGVLAVGNPKEQHLVDKGAGKILGVHPKGSRTFSVDLLLIRWNEDEFVDLQVGAGGDGGF